jgi:hypothetical protein
MSQNYGKGVAGIACLIMILLVILWATIGTAVIMLVWNLAISPVFHVPTIDWGQALLFGLLLGILSSVFGRS